MKPREILQRSFIGFASEVVRSPHTKYSGIAGRVIDETRNTLVLLHDGETKTIIKSEAVFHFTLRDGTIVEVNGKTIIGRPENRIKRRDWRSW